ncbi:MAG: serine/threonine-protein kinase [Pseudomonadota bacterium]
MNALERALDNWERLDDLLIQATALPVDQVEAFCNDACGDDQELRTLLLELATATVVSDERIRGSISQLADGLKHDTLLSGERLGAYCIESLLGRGGMGEVYLASRADGQFEKQVVVKVIQRRLNEGEFVDHFRTERQVLATLSHPYIPGLLDAGQLEDGRPYLVAEYVEGGVPVTDYCQEHGLSLRRRLALVERLAQAVQHAHSKLVLHLDIKPANILVQHDATPKLLDFGIARLINDAQTGHAAFTPDYASPEQIRGQTPTAASDIYSLGVLMYELLGGERPFHAPPYADLQTKLAERDHLERHLRTAAQLTDVPQDLRAIIGKAMSAQAEDRYGSVEAFLQDLTRFRDHRPVSARAPTVAYRLGKYLRRNAVALAVASAIISLLGTFAVREYQLRTEVQIAFERAEQEALTSQQVSDFLTNLFKVSDPSEARGNSVTARDLLDKGAQRISEDLQQQPLVATRMMGVIGTVYVQLGLFDEAIEQFEEAIALRDAVPGGDPAERFELRNVLGDAYLRRGRFDDAEFTLLDNLALITEVLGEDDKRMATTLRKLGDLYMRQRRLDEAEKALLRGLPIREKAVGTEHPNYASHLVSLGIVYSQQNRNEEAEELYLRAIDIIERTDGVDGPILGIYLTNLGNVLGRMGRDEDAEQALLRSLEIAQRVLEPDHPRIANSTMNLAAHYASRKLFEQAERYGQRSLELNTRLFGEADYRVGVSRYNLAEVWSQMERYEQSQAMVFLAIDTWQKVHAPDHVHFGYAYELVAANYRAQSREEEAERYLLQAIEIFETNGDERKRRIALGEYAKLLRATGREARADQIDASLGEPS